MILDLKDAQIYGGISQPCLFPRVGVWVLKKIPSENLVVIFHGDVCFPEGLPSGNLT